MPAPHDDNIMPPLYRKPARALAEYILIIFTFFTRAAAHSQYGGVRAPEYIAAAITDDIMTR